MEDAGTFNDFYLSDQTGLSVSQIRNLPDSIYYGYLAYYDIKHEQEEKERKRASRRSGSKGRESQVF